MRSKFSTSRGFSLVETLVGAALLVALGGGVYQAFATIGKGARLARAENAALALASERLEVIRGMDYDEIGVVGGLPAGPIPRRETVDRGISFEVTTTVRSIDLPFDGTINGTPKDTAPADQKLVEVAVTCDSCRATSTVSTRIAPASLEISTGKGALFVQVVDSAGLPVEGADVLVESVHATTSITIEDRTGVDGFLRVVDVPPGTAEYAVSVGNGPEWSTDRTYPPGGATNPVPTLPDANVVAGAATQVTLSIDRLATLEGRTLKATCEPVGGFDFDLFGQKTIGLATYKYDAPVTTNASGLFGPITLEWDRYSAEPTDGSWTLAGTNPPQPFMVEAGAEAYSQLVVTAKVPKALLVTVLDAGTDLPISNAQVTLSRTGWSAVGTTGLGAASQTGWSGGPGQETAPESPNGFFSSDGKVDYSGSPGIIRLTKTGSKYATAGSLVSSTFDTSTSTTMASFAWLPGTQTSGTSVRFQIAGLNVVTATSTWDFVGTDGTAATYFTTPGQALPAVLKGNRYFRYKVYLATTNTSRTPSVSDVFFTYTLECAPAGQAFFKGLAVSSAYSVAVTAPGYQSATLTGKSVSADWQELTVKLSK